MLPTAEPSRKKACTVLRIVSWNVALALRTKWPALTALVLESGEPLSDHLACVLALR
jgi:hypothetical protein